MSNYKRKDNKNDNSGIYCILNTMNGKRYIGQTYDLDYRWRRHKFDLKHGYHSNNHLQSAWNKYGDSSFEFIVLEKCPLSIIDEREIYWIDYYDTKHSGYNQADGGLGCRGYKHTPEEIKKMRQLHNPKPVLQYSKDGVFIIRWESASQASKALDLYSLAIRNCCERKNYVKSVGGYIWIYEEDKDIVDLNYYLIKNISKPKPVLQFDLNMNLLEIWTSLYEAQLSGLNMCSISAVCNHKRKTYNNYVWRFLDGYSEIEYREDCCIDYSYLQQLKAKKVAQYSLSGDLIKEYPTITEASRETNLDKNRISACCKKEDNLYRNFKWKYVM